MARLQPRAVRATTRCRRSSEDGQRVFFAHPRRARAPRTPTARRAARSLRQHRVHRRQRYPCEDVYEWNDGTLSLISSGTGDRRQRYLLGATPDGQSVFFITRRAPGRLRRRRPARPLRRPLRRRLPRAAAGRRRCEAEACRGAALRPPRRPRRRQRRDSRAKATRPPAQPLRRTLQEGPAQARRLARRAARARPSAPGRCASRRASSSAKPRAATGGRHREHRRQDPRPAPAKALGALIGALALLGVAPRPPPWPARCLDIEMTHQLPKVPAGGNGLYEITVSNRGDARAEKHHRRLHRPRRAAGDHRHL